MSLYIIFDTNYLRSLPSKEYVDGKIPEKLKKQLEIAFGRGDIVAVPRTVQIEINAWANGLAKKELENIRRASDLLKNKGYSISPELNEVAREIDVFALLQQEFPNLYLLEPTIDDYIEAEKRASNRLPPFPKNEDGEEFRDRIIWCQAVRISRITDLPFIIVAGDTLFYNGANSDEGRDANIQVVGNENDLDQRLDQRPLVIQVIVNSILLFDSQLKEKGIILKEESIRRIDGYRAMNEAQGVVVKNFVLVTGEVEGLPPQVEGKIIYRGITPVLLNLRWDSTEIEVLRHLNSEEEFTSTIEQQVTAVKKQLWETELKFLIGD